MKNETFPHTFWRPFLDCMPQLFFRPKYVWFPIHLKGPMIPDPSGQLAELIVCITSTRVDLYSHQILFGLYDAHITLAAISCTKLNSHIQTWQPQFHIILHKATLWQMLTIHQTLKSQNTHTKLWGVLSYKFWKNCNFHEEISCSLQRN